jgi:hypothetical protein
MEHQLWKTLTTSVEEPHVEHPTYFQTVLFYHSRMSILIMH